MNGQIHTWFPKSILVVDQLLEDQLPIYETRIKELLGDIGSDSWRTDMLYVDSTWDRRQKIHEDPIFSNLVNAIYENVEIYMEALGYTSEFYKQLKITNMWANVSKEGDFLYPHVHPNSLLSGAFYIKRTENSKIKFFNNLTDMFPEPPEYNQLNFKFCEYTCDPGRLLLFRSDFLHGTSKQSAGEKIVISFNLSK
jgi:uncharacterized protein (TIGR02466 family)